MVGRRGAVHPDRLPGALDAQRFAMVRAAGQQRFTTGLAHDGDNLGRPWSWTPGTSAG